MNGLDYVLLATIALGALFGSSRGILRIASSLIALIAGAYLAGMYSAPAGAWFAHAFSLSPSTGAALGYVAVFLAVMVVVAWGGGKVSELIQAVHMSWADRLGGAAVGALLGALFAGLIVLLATAALPADAPTLRNSQLAPRVLDFTHDLAGFVPPRLRETYYYREAQLITYWNAHKTAPPGPDSGSAATP